MTATYRTDEWGIPTGGSGGSTQPFGYTGEPRDGTGLSYLRSRYYDPTLGRFLSRDAWPGSPSSPITLNRYAYVGDNPCRWADPSGRDPEPTGPREPNVGACLAGLVGFTLVSESAGLQLLAGLVLQGFSVTLFGVTFAGAAPVSAAGTAAGLLVEGVGLTIETAAFGLLHATCVAPGNGQ